MAAGGTLLLDEIGDMPLPMQAKLLRVLQEREVERVGETAPRFVDIRIIAATGQNLDELVRQGRFRADLYYRIHVIPIRVPALRERREDIMPIAEDFLARLAAETGEPRRTICPELMETFRAYDWPGNVRELHNVLERAVAMSRGETILMEQISGQVLRSLPSAHREGCLESLAQIKAEAERDAIVAALKATGGNKTRAAELLRIHRVKLHEKMKRYRIS